MSMNFGRLFGLRMAHQRADLDVSILGRNSIEAGDSIDVDQQSRPAEPHVERSDQALSAGEQPRVIGAEQLDSMRKRARLCIGKRCRLQVLPPKQLGFLYSRCRERAVNPCRQAAGW